MNILIVDDEQEMISLLTSYLTKEGYKTTAAFDGLEAVEAAHNQELDLILLDIMMPRMDGISALKEIRKLSNVPIIMLTAKGDELDRVAGLKSGADDYVVKPFSPEELVARVEASLRRSNGLKQDTREVLTQNELYVDLNGHIVQVHSEDVTLTRKEFQLLTLLIQNKGRVFPREHLLDHIWGFESQGTIRTVDTHIKTLRLKLQSAGSYIKTVWGVGYKFD